MKNFKFMSIIAAVLMLSAFTVSTSVSWKASEDFTIKFVSADPTGVFTKMEASIIFDEGMLDASKFDLKIDVSSINTGNGMQNKHAISKKWFDAENYPNIHFVSKMITKTATGFKVNGTMEIHGVKKDFDVPFTFKDNVFAAKFPVNRTDFNIGEPGGKAADVMAVEVSVPVSK